MSYWFQTHKAARQNIHSNGGSSQVTAVLTIQQTKRHQHDWPICLIKYSKKIIRNLPPSRARPRARPALEWIRKDENAVVH